MHPKIYIFLSFLYSIFFLQPILSMPLKHHDDQDLYNAIRLKVKHNIQITFQRGYWGDDDTLHIDCRPKVSAPSWEVLCARGQNDDGVADTTYFGKPLLKALKIHDKAQIDISFFRFTLENLGRGQLGITDITCETPETGIRKKIMRESNF